ncbi:Zinc finger HIT domain-containing protein 2 [Linum perenne]
MEEPIITSEKALQASLLDPPSRIICHVCQKQFSQYTCPRCNSRYCSLQCYKSHSVRCTESFMRENVVGELKHMKTSDESKQKMLDILKRVHSEEEEMEAVDEDDDSFLSEQTIEKIASGGEIAFDDLSTEERKRFERAIACGELSKFFKPWDPWWLKPSARAISLGKEGTLLIQPLAEDQPSSSLQHNDGTQEESIELPPAPQTPLQPLSKLIATEPSPLLAIHLVDIIYSYCFTLRLYNGDWNSDAMGSVTVLLTVSQVLGQASQPENVMEALSYCLEQSCSPVYRHMGGSRFGLSVIDDVTTMLSLGRGALISMLADVQRLVQAAGKELKAEKSGKSRSEMRNKLKLAERKVYFIMCWVNEQTDEACWTSLAAIVRTEQTSVLDYCKVDPKVVKSRSKTETRGRVFIEEME